MLRGRMMMLLSYFLLFVPAAIYSTQISFHGCDSTKNQYFKQFPVKTNDGSTEWLPYKYWYIKELNFPEAVFKNFANWKGQYIFYFDTKKGISKSQRIYESKNYFFGSLRSYGACRYLGGKFCSEDFTPDVFYLTGGDTDDKSCKSSPAERGMRLALCYGDTDNTADGDECKVPTNELTVIKKDTNARTYSDYSNGFINDPSWKKFHSFCDEASWCWDCGPNSDPDPTDETNCVCKSGYYTKSGDNLKSALLQCIQCKPGTYFVRQINDDDGFGSLTSVMDDCPNCPVNTYGPANNGTHCLACPLHSTSNIGSVSCECNPGYYAKKFNSASPRSITECALCEASFYCNETRANSDQAICPAGYYCPPGTINPKLCPAGSYCTPYIDPGYGRIRNLASGPEPCLKGFYSFKGWDRCQKCPAKTFCPQNSSYPQNCTAGYYCPDGADKLKCDISGTYCGPGQSNVSFCGDKGRNDPAYVSVAPRDSEQTCRCKEGRVGLGCKLARCSDAMPVGFTLGSLILNSDVTLQQFTASYYSSSVDTLNSAAVYLKNLINSIDVNGDTDITSMEMQYMLKVKSISNFKTNIYGYVWCATPTTGCSVSKVSVRTMFSNARANFHTAPFHTFDGSGILNANNAPAIYKFQATYPNPKFTNEECSNYNILDGNVPPRVTWNFSSPMISDLNVCGYNNGVVDPDFNAAARSTIDLRNGKLTSYFNRNSSSAKRVLCLVVNDRFVCTVALSYDGRPHDLSAALIDGGVAFTYLDTSIRETEFNIFIGPQGSSDADKSFVVGVNYPSFSCGRLSEHISFLDTKRKNSIGQLFEYGVVAIESDSLKSKFTQTAMTIFPYRIPFYIRISGQVTDRSGVGVPNVAVKFCHIDPNTAKRDTNIDFCPVATFYTDNRGEISGELRVSDINWVNMVEYFEASAELTETINGKQVQHDFSPDIQKVRFDHIVGRGEVKFIDLSASSIVGLVLFDPYNTGGNICPFSGVPVTLTDVDTGDTETFLSESDGSFSFSLTKGAEAYISINPYQGHTWRFINDTTSFRSNRRRLFAPHIISHGVGVNPRRKLDVESSQTISGFNVSGASSYVCLYGSCLGGGTCVAGATCVVAPNGYSAICAEVNIPETNCIRTNEYGCAVKACCNSAAFCNSDGNCDLNTLGCLRNTIYVPSSQPSYAPSQQPSKQPNRKPTRQPIKWPSNQPSKQPIRRPSKQPIRQPSNQPSKQPIRRPSKQPIRQPSNQPSKQPIRRPSKQPIRQPSNQPSKQPIKRPSKQPIKWPSNQPTRPPTSQPSQQPTCRPSRQPSIQPTFSPTKQPIKKPSRQPSTQPTYQPSSEPSSQPTSQPTSQPSSQPSVQPSMHPTTQPAPSPSSQPTSQPTNQPSSQPSVQPSLQPTSQPSMRPSSQPTLKPSSQPSYQPTSQPSSRPSAQPSTQPSSQPTLQPSKQPSYQPTTQPSSRPSAQPSAQPSSQPTLQPSTQPSYQPTTQPSSRPSAQPSTQPSSQPTVKPSTQPSYQPTTQPSSRPSAQPSTQPSSQPTVKPSTQPSYQPSHQPSAKPSSQPSSQPSFQPSNNPSFQPSSQPSKCPSMQPNRRPSDQPTSQPTSKPSHQPTILPSVSPSRQPTFSPTLQPSIQPSGQPTAEPTYDPSGQPTSEPSNPTAYPTTFRFHFLQKRRAAKPKAATVSSNLRAAAFTTTSTKTSQNSPQLLSGFSFESYYNSSSRKEFDQYPGATPYNGSQTFDAVGSLVATLLNGVVLSEGDAVFQKTSQTFGLPYISIPGLITAAQSVTVEIWFTFSSWKQDPTATLFSIGSNNNIEFSVRDLNKTLTEYKTYVAVVYDVDTLGKESRTVFVNGTQTSSIRLHNSAITLLSGSARRNEMTFIGTTATVRGRGSSHALQGRISEFRLWDGIFTADEVIADYLAGPMGAGISYHIQRSESKNNINITFLATSLQLVQVYMYGGSNQARMFGSETSFLFTPLDPQCEYKQTLSIFDDDTSGLYEQIPAMNYTVSLVSTASAPKYDNKSCDPTQPNIACFCAESLDPLEYMKNTNQISQTLSVTYVTKSLKTLIFTYKSGVCFEVKGSELFSTSESLYASPSQNISCVKKGSTAVARGRELPLTFYAFERYPDKPGWQSLQPLKTPNYVVNFGVANAQFFVLDLVSGRSSMFSIVYDNSTKLPPPPQRTPVPTGSSYTVEAKAPNPFFPFNQAFQVFVERDDGNGLFSTTYNLWYIPVTGVISNKVPNFYPVPTDSKLIFLVLRDPPGGSSSVTIKAGTTITMGMQIGNVDTSDSSKYSETSADSGEHQQLNAVTAPLGVGTSQTTQKDDGQTLFAYAQPYTVRAMRASNTHYEYKFTFDYDFSTSKEPHLAGHPSDVIVGGGVDLIVNEARGVAMLSKPPIGLKNLDCYYGYDTYQWQPAQVTTFMLTVYEIEQIISQLNYVYKDMKNNINPDSKKSNDINAPKLLSQINNWNQVLSDYRKHNDDLTTIFTADILQFQNMVSAFKSFENGGAVTIDELNAALTTSFSGVIKSISAGNLISQYLTGQYSPDDPISFSIDRLKDSGAAQEGIKYLIEKYAAQSNTVKTVTSGEDLAVNSLNGAKASGEVVEQLDELPANDVKGVKKTVSDTAAKAGDVKKIKAQQLSAAKDTVDAGKDSGGKKGGKGKVKGAVAGALKGIALGAVAAVYEGGMAALGKQGAMDGFRATFDEYYGKAFQKLYKYCDGIKGMHGVQVSKNKYIQTVCSDFDSKSWLNFRSFLNGGCNIPINPSDSSRGMKDSVLFQTLCSKSSTIMNGNNVPGGIASPMGSTSSLLSFLTDSGKGSEKLITFGANAPVTLSWATTIQDSMEFVNELEGTLANEMKVTSFDQFNLGGFIIPGPLSAGSVSDSIQKTGIKITQRSENKHDVTRTMIIDFSDDDMGDYFAVRITEDKAFGTPVFTTMGGVSRCPGETSTSKRDSGVSIVSIQPRCGTDRIFPCDVSNLNYGDVATFGVRIQNLSPTRDSVYYTLRLKRTFDTAFKTEQYQNPSGEKDGYIKNAMGGDCGTPGLLAGLEVKFQATEIVIPYGVTIEVPMGVSMNPNTGSINLCRDFVNIEVELISTCEIPTPHYQVYQYEEAASLYAGAKVLYNVTTGALNSTAMFSVHWPALPSYTQNTDQRKLLQSDGMAESLQHIVEKLNHMDRFEERMNHQHTIVILQSVFIMALLVILAALSLRILMGFQKEKEKIRSPKVVEP